MQVTAIAVLRRAVFIEVSPFDPPLFLLGLSSAAFFIRFPATKQNLRWHREELREARGGGEWNPERFRHWGRTH
jgi:hypothetical protein